MKSEKENIIFATQLPSGIVFEKYPDIPLRKAIFSHGYTYIDEINCKGEMLLTFLVYVLQRHRAILMPEFWQIKWQTPDSWLHSFKTNSSSAVSCRCNNCQPAHPDVPKLSLQISFIAQLLVTAWL